MLRSHELNRLPKQPSTRTFVGLPGIELGTSALSGLCGHLADLPERTKPQVKCHVNLTKADLWRPLLANACGASVVQPSGPGPTGASPFDCQRDSAARTVPPRRADRGPRNSLAPAACGAASDYDRLLRDAAVLLAALPSISGHVSPVRCRCRRPRRHFEQGGMNFDLTFDAEAHPPPSPPQRPLLGHPAHRFAICSLMLRLREPPS